MPLLALYSSTDSKHAVAAGILLVCVVNFIMEKKKLLLVI
mgnify:CR=1 FL=1